MAPIPVGLQLYSVRNDCAADLPGTLAAVAKMGYAGVEFAGTYDRSAKELRTMLDDLGLKCCGTHIRIDTLLGDALPATVEFNQILGNKYLIVPGLAEEYRNSRAAWLRTAGIFNEIAERLQTLRDAHRLSQPLHRVPADGRRAAVGHLLRQRPT